MDSLRNAIQVTKKRTEVCFAFCYMLCMKEWIEAAMAFANLKQASLQRLLSEKYQWPDGRVKINRLLSGQQLGAQEMLEISAVTGYPVPDVPNQNEASWQGKLEAALSYAGHINASPDEALAIFAKHVPLTIVPQSASSLQHDYSADKIEAVVSALKELLPEGKGRRATLP